MKLLFIYRVNREDAQNIGVIKKLIGQVSACQALGHEVDYICHDYHYLTMNHQRIDRPRNWSKVWTKFRFYHYLEKKFDFSYYDQIILRYSICTPSFISFLKSYSSKFPNTKIVIDMPTYPYAQEWKGIMSPAILAIDRYYSHKLKNYVVEIWHSGSEKKIFGVQTIPFNNGIAENEISRRDKFIALEDQLVLIAIAKWQYWHGLDRVLEGLKNYYSTSTFVYRVKLIIAGNGPALSELKNLALRLDINSHIEWVGIAKGDTLHQLIKKSHIGIGTLGLHRKGVMKDSSLKHRLYAAYGLPFILSSPDDDFPDQLSFVKYCSADESTIDINRLIDFYHWLSETVPQDMYLHATNKLTWEKKMNEVLSHQ